MRLSTVLELCQRFCQLIGAGSPFAAAVDTAQFRNGFIHLHAGDQRCDSLCIAMAAADELHPFDAIVLDGDVEQFRTGSAGCIDEVFLHFFRGV